MASISLYLDKRVKSKTGLYRIKISIRNGKSSYFIPTEIKVKEENWVNGNIVGTSTDRSLNKLLSMKVSALKLKLVSVAASMNIESLTAKQLASLLDNGVLIKEEEGEKCNNDMFLPFVENFISRKEKQSTKDVYINTKAKISKYCDIKKLRFGDITYKWICDFERYMASTGNSVNTRSINMRNIRALYNEAVKENVISAENYPFKMFSIRSEETAKRSLSIDELRTLRDYPCVGSERKWVDLFFLSFYLAGINLVDLFALPPLVKGKKSIEYRRSKTNVLCQLNIPYEAQILIKKYKGKEHLVCFGEDYPNRRSLVHRMNEVLQKIGQTDWVDVRASNNAVHQKKIRKPYFPNITSYWARHTWATIAADLDIPYAVIDAALGHKSPYRMTDIYVRRNIKKVNDAIRKVIDYVNEK